MILKYFAFALISLAALLFSSEYRKYSEKRLAEYDEALRIVRRIRGAVSDYLAPPDEWLAGYSSEVLNVACDGGGFREQSLKILDVLSLDGVSRGALADFFSTAPALSSEELVKGADKLISQLDEQQLKMRAEMPKSIKTVSVISAAAALGIIILFI